MKVSGKEKILAAALSLITRRGGADVSMQQIAKAARMSRQAVYLHFGDRGELLQAVVRYADESRGLEAEIQKIRDAPTGLEAIRRMVSLQARSNHQIWAPARAFEAVRRTDPAAERGWQDRLQHRLEGCRQIMRKVEQDGDLRPGMDVKSAADLLWTTTSLRMWEDLVLLRGWSAERYQKHVYDLVV
ncbi:MAG TPA: TetR/AcrR family transcriptional regulator, partial [Candidatus Nitrosotalea sp.]|nr:TetR/AcrR family transcriptional regulator [Candidatus Nitrosotalea sp.]